MSIAVVECPVCGMIQVITEEHHVCSSCGYEFFDATEEQRAPAWFAEGIMDRSIERTE